MVDTPMGIRDTGQCLQNTRLMLIDLLSLARWMYEQGM
jgi:hypothetical protein